MWRNIDVRADPPTAKEIRQVRDAFARRAKPRFLADENFPAPTTDVLRQMGAKVHTAQREGLVGHSDEDQVAHALRNRLVLLTCDRDYLDERRFPLIHCPAIFVFDFGAGSVGEMKKAFRCLAGVFAAPEFIDKWCKVDAKRDGWTESVRYQNGSTSRQRYRLWQGKLQEWAGK